MSKHFHLSFKKKFLDQVFLSLQLVLPPCSQSPLESTHSAPENNDMLQGNWSQYIFIRRPVFWRPLLPFGRVGSHQQSGLCFSPASSCNVDISNSNNWFLHYLLAFLTSAVISSKNTNCKNYKWEPFLLSDCQYPFFYFVYIVLHYNVDSHRYIKILMFAICYLLVWFSHISSSSSLFNFDLNLFFFGFFNSVGWHDLNTMMQISRSQLKLER